MKKLLSLLITLVISLAILTGCPQPTTTASETTATPNSTYTYRTALGANPSTINPHTWEVSHESTALNPLTAPLFEFRFSEDYEGYEVVPLLAASEPIDVTSTYAAEWGLGTSGQAWLINLDLDAKWANGEQIDADDYLYSMQQILNPLMANRRADSFYSGQLQVKNAEAYFKQGSTQATSLGSYMDFMDCATIADAITAAGDAITYINRVYSYGDEEAEDEVLPTELNLGELYAEYSSVYLGWGLTQPDIDAYALDELYVDYTYPPIEWEEVGFLKVDQDTIVYIINNPLNSFYLKYNLSSSILVNETLYEAGKTTEGSTVITNYGSSAATIVSHGPYSLTEWQIDSHMTYVKNETFVDADAYQVTGIEMKIMADMSTQVMYFENGDIDDVAISGTYLDEYVDDPRQKLFLTSYTYCIILNSDTTKTTERNSKILLNAKFREGLSLAMNREEFVSGTVTGSPSVNLLNSAYIMNEVTGVPYRSYAEAIAVNEAMGAETNGYDITAAKALFNEAYTEMMTGGWDGTTPFTIELLTGAADDPTHQARNTWLMSTITNAIAGTSLEGKITLTTKSVPGGERYDLAEAGNFDIFWGAWGGGDFDPAGLLQLYCEPSLANEYGFNCGNDLDVTYDGVTMSMYEWYVELNDGDYVSASTVERAAILAAVELAFLQTYVRIPLYSMADIVLSSTRLFYPVDTYMPVMGFGTLRDMEIGISDQEWDLAHPNA